MLPSTHQLARRKSITLEELRDEYWALDTRGTYSEAIIRACAKAGFRPLVKGNCNRRGATLPTVLSTDSAAIITF